jgi:hypothetical protein
MERSSMGLSKGKSSKICAELCTDSQSNIILFLWLPYKGGKSQRVGRARIWTDWQESCFNRGICSQWDWGYISPPIKKL